MYPVRWVANFTLKCNPCLSMNVYGTRTTDIEDRSPAAVAGGRVWEPENASHSTDARSTQLNLERSLQSLPAGAETSAKKPEPKPAGWGVGAPRRLIKIALGLSLVGSLGWGPLRAMLTSASVEALVNARVETIRSPIEGVVLSAPDLNRGWNVPFRRRVCASSTRLPIMSRLDDLRRQYQALEFAVAHARAPIRTGERRVADG